MSVGIRVSFYMAACFAANAIIGFMPLWFADRGLTPTQIGQVLGFAGLLRVFAGPAWGIVADRLGRRRPVLLGAGCAAASMALLYVASTGFLPILLVAAGQGLCASAINPLADSLALSLAREERMEYGPVRAVGSASFMVATAVAGWLLTAVGSWLVPWMLALGYGSAAAVTPFLPEARTPPAPPRLGGAFALFRNRAFLLAVGGTALIQGSHAAYYGFAALLWRSQGISDQIIGLLIAEGIVAEILLFARGRALIAWLGPPGLTACAALASIVRWSITAFSPSLAILFVVQILHAGTFAMQHQSSMLILSRAVPPERAATAQALHSALGYGAPAGITMLVTGWLYMHYGGLAFLAMAALGGAGLLLVAPTAAALRRLPALASRPTSRS